MDEHCNKIGIVKTCTLIALILVSGNTFYFKDEKYDLKHSFSQENIINLETHKATIEGQD